LTFHAVFQPQLRRESHDRIPDDLLIQKCCYYCAELSDKRVAQRARFVPRPLSLDEAIRVCEHMDRGALERTFSRSAATSSGFAISGSARKRRSANSPVIATAASRR